MTRITAVGIDLAKSFFQICAVNQAEKLVFTKKVKRSQLLKEVINLPPCKIFMEACGGCHDWARQFEKLGHEVKLIAGQHVKKFVVGNKDDAIDARAIVTCGLRPTTRFVPIKNADQLETQALHRIRTRLVKERTALCNEMRAFLYDQGIAMAKTRGRLEAEVKGLIALDSQGLRPALKQIIADLFHEYVEKCALITDYEKKIHATFKQDPRREKLLAIPGVGPLTASAMMAEIDSTEFENGRHLSAFLGLVPAHTGSGGRNTNHKMSKRGDCYLRTLLIHGARSALRFTGQREDRLAQWCESLKKRMPSNKAAVALANKNARIIWKILKTGEDFRPEKAA